MRDETLEEEEEDVDMEIGNETIELEDEDKTDDENNKQKQEDEGEEEEGAKQTTKDTKIRIGKGRKSESIRLKRPLWILKHRFGDQDNQPFKLVEISEEKQSFDKEFDSHFIFDLYNWINNLFLFVSWLKYVEEMNDLMSNPTVINRVFKANLALMNSISQVPKDWSLCKDEDLASMLKDFINTDLPGSIRNLIRSITVSTQRVLFLCFI